LFFYSKKEDRYKNDMRRKRAAKLKKIAEVVKPTYESLMSPLLEMLKFIT